MTQPKTVMYVVDSLGLSGKTRALANLVLNLDRVRFKGVVATFAPPEGILAEQLQAANVPVEHVPCTDGVRVDVAGRLLGLMRRHRPAIVHCFNPRPMLYGGLASAAMSRPAIGSLSAFACMGAERSYSFLPQPLHTRSLRNRLRNRILGKLMKRVAAVSVRAGQAFCESNAIPAHKLRVIGYGVELGGVARAHADDIARVRAAVGASPDELLVGSVGRLVEQKDYPNQLRALALAARRAPLRMIIAGAGPLEGQLRDLARRLGIADRVRWLGERRDVPTLLRCIDAFCIASKFEPFGVSVLEAMAASLPIVSTDVNELPEILDGGRAGMVVPAERPEDFAEALEKVSSDPELRTRLGTHARSIANDRYSLRAAVTAYVNLYEEVLGA